MTPQRGMTRLSLWDGGGIPPQSLYRAGQGGNLGNRADFEPSGRLGSRPGAASAMFMPVGYRRAYNLGAMLAPGTLPDPLNLGSDPIIGVPWWIWAVGIYFWYA